jgi:hypothetical protein
MKIKTNPKYTYKYDKVVKKYTFEELQNLLDSCKSKTALCLKLKLSLKYLNMIIELNGLKYVNKDRGLPPGFVHKPKKIDKEETIKVRLTQEMISEDTALARFYKELEVKKKKRLIKDVLDPYGD